MSGRTTTNDRDTDFYLRSSALIRVLFSREKIVNAIDQINSYIEAQPDPKRSEMRTLHDLIMSQFSDCILSYLDGKDDQGKVVTNPNIGYGQQKLYYADGSSRDFYQIGMSANSSGISIFIMGLKDRNYLPEKYGKSIGKAAVTSYCIKFKRVGEIDKAVLLSAVRDGIELTST